MPSSPPLSPDRLLEIACDESGYEGEKLIGTTTDVFAHASVRLDTEAASACMDELRDRIRSPATQYKANHLLREKHRPVLEWLLGPSAPLLGETHVYLIDKAFFVLATVFDHDTAVSLYRDGPGLFGPERWNAFLIATNDLMRVKGGGSTFAGIVEPLDLIGHARARAEAFRARLRDDPTMVPPMDPLIPAIVQAVTYWGGNGHAVSVAHDRQNTLPDVRIAQLKARLPRLERLTLVDAGTDPRIQLADILAGVVRKIATDELNGRGGAQLTALACPYLDASSIWADPRSWSALTGT